MTARVSILAAGITFTQLFSLYKTERKPPRKTCSDYGLYVNRFVSLIGDLPIASIKKAHLRDFKNALIRCPAVIPAALNCKPFAEALLWADNHPDEPRLAAQTINGRGLGGLSAIFGWAVDNDLMDSNPRRGVKVAETKMKGDKRRPYSPADLQLIFNLPIFANPPHRPRAGGGDAARWFPLIALFTGARLSEIGQLRVADIRLETALPVGQQAIPRGRSIWFEAVAAG